MAGLLVGLSACEGDERNGAEHQRTSEHSRGAPVPAAEEPERIVVPPRWIRGYCRAAADEIAPPFRCIDNVPEGLAPGPNQKVLRPSARGYVFEGTSATHWAFGAALDDRSVLDNYGRSRALAKTRVRGRPAQWRLASKRCGIFAEHLVLQWRERRFAYAVSVHTDEPDSDAQRRAVLQVARQMRTY
jgi:hypothetical protein